MKVEYKQGARAVLCDLDGLLLDNMPGILDAFRQAALAEAGTNVRQDFLERTAGLNYSGLRDLVLKELGSSFPFDRVLERQRAIIDGSNNRLGIKLKEGVPELVALCEQNGTALAVVSGARKYSVDRKLAFSGLTRHFEITVCGDEVGQYGKPAPRSVLLARRKLISAGKLPRLTPTCHLLMCGDGLTDIESAKAANMNALYVADGRYISEAAQKANFACRSLVEALPYIKGWLGQAQ